MKEHDFAGCGKLFKERKKCQGHDFSRAAKAAKRNLGFSPCGVVLIKLTRYAAPNTCN